MISTSLEEAFGVVGGSSIRFDVLQIVPVPEPTSGSASASASRSSLQVKGRGLLRTMPSSNVALARDESERLAKAISLCQTGEWRLSLKSTSHGFAFEGTAKTSREWFEGIIKASTS